MKIKVKMGVTATTSERVDPYVSAEVEMTQKEMDFLQTTDPETYKAITGVLRFAHGQIVRR